MSGGHPWDVLGSCFNRLLPSPSLGWRGARLAAAQSCGGGAAASLARGFGKFCLCFWEEGTRLQQSALANFSTPEGPIVQELFSQLPVFKRWSFWVGMKASNSR